MSNVIEEMAQDTSSIGETNIEGLENYISMVSRTNKFNDGVKDSYYKKVYEWWRQQSVALGATTGCYLTALNVVDSVLYPLVKGFSIQPGMTALERNKATNFHRSVVSTLRKYAMVLDNVEYMVPISMLPLPSSQIAKLSKDRVRPAHAIMYDLVKLRKAIDKYGDDLGDMDKATCTSLLVDLYNTAAKKGIKNDY